MRFLRFSKTAMPTMAPRLPSNIRAQMHPISRLLASTSPFRSYSSSLFSSISPKRPILPSNHTTTALHTSTSPATATISLTPSLNQIRSFSASACLAGKRATYRPSRLVQKRRHGFLSRLRTRTGRKILMRRRLKGRRDLSW